jgi:hypothetical protein
MFLQMSEKEDLRHATCSHMWTVQASGKSVCVCNSAHVEECGDDSLHEVVGMNYNGDRRQKQSLFERDSE